MAFVQVLFLAEEIDTWVISNHRPPTTITPPPDKPNKSGIHEQSNTISTNISILFENLARKLERSKRFGFEKNKFLLWMMVILDLLVFLVKWCWLVRGSKMSSMVWIGWCFFPWLEKLRAVADDAGMFGGGGSRGVWVLFYLILFSS